MAFHQRHDQTCPPVLKTGQVDFQIPIPAGPGQADVFFAGAKGQPKQPVSDLQGIHPERM